MGIPLSGQLPARKQAQKVHGGPGHARQSVLGTVGGGDSRAVAGGSWDGLARDTGYCSERRPPCAERGSGCSGLLVCPNRRRRMVQRDSVRGAVERVMGPPIGRAPASRRTSRDGRVGG